jgi:hypothetical protein
MPYDLFHVPQQFPTFQNTLIKPWNTSGSAITNKPQVLIEHTGALSNGWNTLGTGLGVNSPSNFLGDLLALCQGGTKKVSMDIDSNGYSYIRLTTPGGQITTLWAAFGRLDVSGSASNGAISVSGDFATATNGGGQIFAASANGATRYWTLNNDGSANILSMRNAATGQTIRLYGTYTDASNYVRLSLATTTTTATIAAESAGTGAANIDLTFTPKGTGVIQFGTYASSMVEIYTGYISIKDSAGTTRKLAVFA